VSKNSIVLHEMVIGLEDLRRESTIYLLPEYDTEEEGRGYMREYCSEIFEEQLDG